MKNQIVLVAAFATIAAVAFAFAGCSKSASVQGEGSGKLTLIQPSAVTIERGGMTKTDIRIARKDLAGDVSIEFSKLPRGVEVVESGTKIVGDHGDYTLRAAADADLVTNYSALVTAKGGPGSMAVSQPIDITVKAKQ